MRVRKVLNFYLDEPAHADLLDFLEAIEGDTRRQQALLQMALVGFRVIEKHESGPEAYFKARNPDVARLVGAQEKPVIERALVTSKKSAPKRNTRTYEAKDVVNSSESFDEGRVYQPSSLTPESIVTTDNPEVLAPTFNEPEDIEVFEDPLALLQKMTEER